MKHVIRVVIAPVISGCDPEYSKTVKSQTLSKPQAKVEKMPSELKQTLPRHLATASEEN